MKILVYHWNSYNQKAVEDTITKLGNNTALYTEKPNSIEKDTEYTQKLADNLRKHKYDLLFSVNYFPVLSKACHETSTPYVCWNCDSPLLAMYNNSVFYDTNFIFTFDYSNYEEFKNIGAKHIYHLPLATGTDANFIVPALIYKYDISFIGSLYEKNSFDDISPKLPDYLCGYFDGALYAQLQVSGGNIIEKLLTPDICLLLEGLTNYHKASDSFADIRTLFSTTVLGFKAASMQRILYLNRLSLYLNKSILDGRKCFLNLFTDSSTDELPFVKCHKSADYYTQAPIIFNQSKINLNMTIPNIKTGIPLRVWDILSNGGFLMTDYRIELLDYFKPDKDIVIFEDSDELTDKAGFYLSHDSIRNKIAQSAYNKVSTLHTCQNRIKNILDTVSKEI